MSYVHTHTHDLMYSIASAHSGSIRTFFLARYTGTRGIFGGRTELTQASDARIEAVPKLRWCRDL